MIIVRAFGREGESWLSDAAVVRELAFLSMRFKSPAPGAGSRPARAPEVVEQGDRFFEALAYSKACDAYRAAIARSADGLYCAELYNRMGWASLLRGDDDAALEEFEQAIKYNGLCVHSRYNLATMLLHRGDSAAAETHLRLALAPQAATAGSSDDDAARLKVCCCAVLVQ